MAKTVEQIRIFLDGLQALKPELNEMDSPSDLADFKLWKDLFADASHSILTEHEMFLDEIREAAKASKYGTPDWLKDRIDEFQYGDPLLEKDGKEYYAVVDDAKRIIKQRAVVETPEGGYLIKVLAAAGVKLNAEQKQSFTYYINDLKPPGKATQIITEDPDNVKGIIDVYFDGKLDKAAFELLFQATINNYLSNIIFNGVLNKGYFYEALKGVAGVIAIDLKQLNIKPENSVTWNVVEFERSSYSGHFKFKFDQSTINYIRR